MFDDVLVWFRRDLRAEDHAALSQALAAGRRVHCAFLFDRAILDPLPDRADRRVAFIHGCVAALDRDLRAIGAAAGGAGGGLTVLHGSAEMQIPCLAAALRAGAVFANGDVEPAARARDARVGAALAERGIAWQTFADQTVLAGDALRAGSGRPYSVFSAYKRAWLRHLAERDWQDLAPWPVADRAARLQPAQGALLPLAQIGFAGPPPDNPEPGTAAARARLAAFLPHLAAYAERRDYPAADATSGLAVHLRFGTLSVRELVRAARAAGEAGEAWLSELIWREFFFMILDRFPRVVDGNFQRATDAVRWADWPAGFAAWSAGRTGYPLVDAGMRELNAHGTMHNRVRMVVASFLTKHLGIDWRAGERYFANRLLDYDLAANNGNWQWAASTGCDAQPWFRIFNPVTQSQRFDSDGVYIRRHVPELAALAGKAIHAPWLLPGGPPAGYPPPIVEHAAARAAALARFGVLRTTGVAQP